MTISEKAAYIKGLMDGLNIDTTTAEGKVLEAVVDLLGEMAENVTEAGERIDELVEEVDAISSDLLNVEEIVYDDVYDEDNEDDEDYDDDEVYEYSVECPACGKDFVIDEETLDSNIINCPHCGEVLELEFEDEEYGEPEED